MTEICPKNDSVVKVKTSNKVKSKADVSKVEVDKDSKSKKDTSKREPSKKNVSKSSETKLESADKVEDQVLPDQKKVKKTSQTKKTKVVAVDDVVDDVTQIHPELSTLQKIVDSVDLSKQVKEKKSKPLASDECGFNISLNKIKNIISNNILNKTIFNTLTELKVAMPKTVVKKDKDGIETKEEFLGIPISNLSNTTQSIVKEAIDNYLEVQFDDVGRSRIKAMTVEQKELYKTAKNTYKENLSNDVEFKLDTFNQSYDKTFYSAFDKTKLLQTDNEWQFAIEKISKLKNRFSNSARTILSMICEYLMEQVIQTSVSNCLDEKKKSVQISHLHSTKTSELPLFKLLVNLDMYNLSKTYTDSTEFNVTGVPANQQYQFRFFVNETFRKIKKNLVDANQSITISKQYKSFCSALLTDFIMRIGTMMLTEIEHLDIKTVSDCTVNTVIAQYYNVCGVKFLDTDTYVNVLKDKYDTYTQAKHQLKLSKKVVV